MLPIVYLPDQKEVNKKSSIVRFTYISFFFLLGSSYPLILHLWLASLFFFRELLDVKDMLAWTWRLNIMCIVADNENTPARCKCNCSCTNQILSCEQMPWWYLVQKSFNWNSSVFFYKHIQCLIHSNLGNRPI